MPSRPVDLDGDAGFFAGLAFGALGHGLADLLLAYGDRPLAGVAAALEQHPAVGVDGEEDTQAAGTRLFGLGASGSLRYSVRPGAIRFPLRAAEEDQGMERAVIPPGPDTLIPASWIRGIECRPQVGLDIAHLCD